MVGDAPNLIPDGDALLAPLGHIPTLAVVGLNLEPREDKLPVAVETLDGNVVGVATTARFGLLGTNLGESLGVLLGHHLGSLDCEFVVEVGPTASGGVQGHLVVHLLGFANLGFDFFNFLNLGQHRKLVHCFFGSMRLFNCLLWG